MLKRVQISLIHGTFAKNAGWTEETSSFCKSIVAGLDVNATFRRPQWTGRNNAKDRIAAADELAASLNAARSADPDCLQIVIGHSHGGSVLAYALTRHPELAKFVAGVFLSTPFIDARPRRNWFLTAMIIAFAISCTLLSLLFLGQMVIFGRYLEPLSINLFVAVSMGIDLPVMFFAFFFPLFWAPSAIVKSNPRQLARGISTCRLPEGRYLFVRITGDEASSALAATQFTAWLFSKLVHGATSIVPERLRDRSLFFPKSQTGRWLVNVLRVRFPVILLVVLAFFSSLFGAPFLILTIAHPEKITLLWGAMAIASKQTPIFGTWFDFLIFIVFIVGSVVEIAIFALMIIFLLLSWLNHRTLGGASFKAMMFLEMAVEPVPIGSHTVVHATWAANYRGLTHSSAYQNPNTIAVIRTWIASIAKS